MFKKISEYAAASANLALLIPFPIYRVWLQLNNNESLPSSIGEWLFEVSLYIVALAPVAIFCWLLFNRISRVLTWGFVIYQCASIALSIIVMWLMLLFYLQEKSGMKVL